MKKFGILFIALVGFAVSSFGQAIGNATASATIVTPIAIAKVNDMNFGNVASGTGGTVVLDPAGTRTATGNVKLPSVTGSVSAAVFTVTGSGASTYTIILPGTLTLTRVSGTETMTVDTWTSTPTVAAGGVLTAGTQTLRVGATLNVGSSQATGVYENSAGFDVTVNYN